MRQLDWMAPDDSPRRLALMTAIDRINARWGRGTLTLGVEQLSHGWAMRQERLSPRYTTRWEDVPIAR